MGEMGLLSADELLHLPLRLRGIRLGHAVDLLLAPSTPRVVGFVIVCGDDTPRFLPFAAARPCKDAIEVASALVLLEDVDFYRGRARSLRSLRGGTVRRDGRPAGELRDLVLSEDGAVCAVVVARDGREERLDIEGTTLSSEQAAA